MTTISSSLITAEELYDKLKGIQTDNPLCRYSLDRCKQLTPMINAVQQLKIEKNALVLAHSSVHPDIIYGVADHVGDSYGLSRIAKDTDADLILFPAVRFMAETAKILNPSKTVIDPNPNGGCSLADSIEDSTVFQLREKYPMHTFVCYINTTAAVKAACDVCVTSSNAFQVIKNVPNDKIYFLPDRLMGQNLQNMLLENGIDKELIYYSGSCYVHEQFSKNEVSALKQWHPEAKVLAHPECSPEIVAMADLVSSTNGIVDYVKANHHSSASFLILTECGIASRLQAEYPHLQLVGSCMMCRYMKSNHIEFIYESLLRPSEDQIITIDPEIQKRAFRTLQAMFTYSI